MGSEGKDGISLTARHRKSTIHTPLLVVAFILALILCPASCQALESEEEREQLSGGAGESGAGAGADEGVCDDNTALYADIMSNANMTNRYLDELAEISDSDFHLERTFLSPGSLRALASVRRWMEDAGLRTWLDSVGNLHGRLDASSGSSGEEKVLLLGSHIDTVVDGGAYDGTLGIVTAITAVRNLKIKAEAEDRDLKRSVEVIAFSDEEGLRFKSTFLGSRAVSGTFLKHGYLEARDSKGYTLASVLETVGLSNSKEDIAKIAMTKDEVYGYVEVHIEQGPVLQSLNQPVGVVSAISGQTRLYVQVEGFSGHAGTVPMNQRKDTIACSAEMIHAIETECVKFPMSAKNMLVCTVGEFNVFPGASNVIPGYANFSIDIRCKDDLMREKVVDLLQVSLEDIAKRRNVGCEIETKHSAESCQSSPVFTESLKQGILDAHEFIHKYRDKRPEAAMPIVTGQDGGGSEGLLPWAIDEPSVPVIASGAGHDALAMSEITPIGMLFVRCRDGISHSPLEFVKDKDVTIASLSLFHFLVKESLAKESLIKEEL